MTDCVTVIRTKAGDDIIAVLTGKLDNTLRVDHPYFARLNPVTGNVTMVPFCPLSDEIHFKLDMADIQFVVTASEEISKKFLAMVYTTDSSVEEEDDIVYNTSQVIPGNTTKH